MLVRLHSKKPYFFIAGIIWLILLPVLLHFLSLYGMDIKWQTTVEKFDIEHSPMNIGTPEKEYGLASFHREALREKSFFLKEIFYIHSKISQSHSKSFFLHC